MTTSYSENIRLSNVFVYHTLDSQVSLSSCMSIKAGLFLFVTFCSIIPIFGIIDHYSIIENLKTTGRN